MTKPKHVQLVGLSRKSTEAQIQRNMRINQHSSAHALPVLSEKALQRVRGTTAYVKRERLANEALPNTMSVWKSEPYVTGDGDSSQYIRQGSMDAYRKPSRGFST